MEALCYSHAHLFSAPLVRRENVSRRHSDCRYETQAPFANELHTTLDANHLPTSMINRYPEEIVSNLVFTWYYLTSSKTFQLWFHEFATRLGVVLLVKNAEHSRILGPLLYREPLLPKSSRRAPVRISFEYITGSRHDPVMGTHLYPPSATAIGGINLYWVTIRVSPHCMAKKEIPFVSSPAT